jgi:PAS domain S-box-containing protein
MGLFVLLPEDMTLTKVNAKCLELSGYTREEIEGKMKTVDFVAEQDLERLKQYHFGRREKNSEIPSEYEFKFVDKYGQEKDVIIQTANVELDEKSVTPFHLQPGKFVKISVADTGVGMDETTKQRIFEPFFTTKEMGRGTGLGLASAYGIIQNHGGFIDVHSSKGQGANFDIYLPVSPKKVVMEEKPPQVRVGGKETVLLVDDEDMIVDIGRQILQKLGYKTISAGSGQDAIECFRKHRDEIDLVILDMIMPDMNGEQTYLNLKGLDPDVKVLLSSGYSIDGQAAKIMQQGCNGFIQKPFHMEILATKIREILDRD